MDEKGYTQGNWVKQFNLVHTNGPAARENKTPSSSLKEGLLGSRSVTFRFQYGCFLSLPYLSCYLKNISQKRMVMPAMSWTQSASMQPSWSFSLYPQPYKKQRKLVMEASQVHTVIPSQGQKMCPNALVCAGMEMRGQSNQHIPREPTVTEGSEWVQSPGGLGGKNQLQTTGLRFERAQLEFHYLHQLCLQ